MQGGARGGAADKYKFRVGACFLTPQSHDAATTSSRPLVLAHRVRISLKSYAATELTKLGPLSAVDLPFPSAANALLVKCVIEVDQLLRPAEVIRTLSVSDCTLHVSVLRLLSALEALLTRSCRHYEALTVSHARVAMDHCLSDIQLVVQTMHTFAPGRKSAVEEAESLEVGLRGTWGGDA